MQHRRAFPVAQAQETARLFLQVVGEILAARDRAETVDHACLAHQFARHLQRKFGLRCAIDDDRVARHIVDFDAGAISVCMRLRERADARLEQLADLGVERAHADLQTRCFGDHVRRVPCIEGTDRDHGGLHRIDAA